MQNNIIKLKNKNIKLLLTAINIQTTKPLEKHVNIDLHQLNKTLYYFQIN